MNPVEHSQLLFLVEALRVAPGKSAALLKMAENKRASQPYRDAIKELHSVAHDTTALRASSDRIKESLR